MNMVFENNYRNGPGGLNRSCINNLNTQTRALIYIHGKVESKQ